MGVMNIEALADKIKYIASILRVSNSLKGTPTLQEKAYELQFFSKWQPPDCWLLLPPTHVD